MLFFIPPSAAALHLLGFPQAVIRYRSNSSLEVATHRNDFISARYRNAPLSVNGGPL